MTEINITTDALTALIDSLQEGQNDIAADVIRVFLGRPLHEQFERIAFRLYGWEGMDAIDSFKLTMDDLHVLIRNYHRLLMAEASRIARGAS